MVHLRWYVARRHRNGFNTVMCAIDFSALSRRALRYAAVVASRAHGTLAVLFVNDPLLVAAAGAARPRLDLPAQSARELDRFIRTVLGNVTSLAVERRVATGEPADEILSAARESGADLIVVGSHGLTGIARLAFGSTTAAVLKRSPVPVLVVPTHDRATRRELLSWPRGCVVAPVMLDRRTAGNIDTVSRVAASFGCTLTLVHVIASPVLPEWLRIPVKALRAPQLEPTRQRLAALAASRARVPARVRVAHGSPADMIDRLARRERACLLVAMLRDRDRWFEPGRGALTYRIFSQAHVPVLACPPRWRPQ